MSNTTTADVRRLGLAGGARERQRQRQERRGGGVLYCTVYYTALYCIGGAGEAQPRPDARVQGHKQGAQGKTKFFISKYFFITKYFSGAHQPTRVPGRERVSLGRDDVARE